MYWVAEPLLRLAPSGDGHPVIVLPGFLGDDRSTWPLRRHLGRLGYAVHGWRLGRNIGPTSDVITGMSAAVCALAEEHDRTISLVGWSLGGIYARELARVHPECVRQVITLGSPIRLRSLDQTNTEPIYSRLRSRHDARFRAPGYVYVDEPLSMPSSAFYTRTDGIVAWQTCVQPAGALSENIEVLSSHCGLGHNASVVYAVSDRLAQPEGEWRPFLPSLPLRYLYPHPVDG
jgi:pimeloyl-ACP methyl ester carboxylesterase